MHLGLIRLPTTLRLGCLPTDLLLERHASGVVTPTILGGQVLEYAFSSIWSLKEVATERVEGAETGSL